MDWQTRPASEATLHSLTEHDFANYCSLEGARIVCHNGRYWAHKKAGFYSTVHLLARLSEAEATSPTMLSWGFRATLNLTDTAAANTSVPVHLLGQFDGYEASALPKNRRTELRNCLQRVEITELTGPRLLREQGWDVMTDSLARVGGGVPMDKGAYLASLDTYINPKRRVVLAGVVDGIVAGYAVIHAVDGTAYIEKAYYRSSMMSTHVSTGLLYEIVQMCRRSPGIREVVHGLHSRENTGLTWYKASMGFAVTHLPTKVEVNSVAAAIFRWKRPDAYYRLIGDGA